MVTKILKNCQRRSAELTGNRFLGEQNKHELVNPILNAWKYHIINPAQETSAI